MRPNVFGLVDQREVAVGTHQRHLLGDRRRHPGRNVLGRGVDRVGAHHPVGGVLAAGDRHQAGRGHRHRMLARQLGRLLALPCQQRTQPGVHPVDVVVCQRRRQHRVDGAEDVVDVGLGRGRMGQVEIPVGVGGADDPVRAPRDDEQHRLLGAQDDRHLAHDAVAGDHDVHALGCPHPKSPALLGQCLNLVGPHAGGVDHDVPAHLGDGPVLGVAHLDARRPGRPRAAATPPASRSAPPLRSAPRCAPPSWCGARRRRRCRSSGYRRSATTASARAPAAAHRTSVRCFCGGTDFAPPSWS